MSSCVQGEEWVFAANIAVGHYAGPWCGSHGVSILFAVFGPSFGVEVQRPLPRAQCRVRDVGVCVVCISYAGCSSSFMGGSDAFLPVRVTRAGSVSLYVRPTTDIVY